MRGLVYLGVIGSDISPYGHTADFAYRTLWRRARCMFICAKSRVMIVLERNALESDRQLCEEE